MSDEPKGRSDVRPGRVDDDTGLDGYLVARGRISPRLVELLTRFFERNPHLVPYAIAAFSLGEKL